MSTKELAKIAKSQTVRVSVRKAKGVEQKLVMICIKPTPLKIPLRIIE